MKQQQKLKCTQGDHSPDTLKFPDISLGFIEFFWTSRKKIDKIIQKLSNSKP